MGGVVEGGYRAGFAAGGDGEPGRSAAEKVKRGKNPAFSSPPAVRVSPYQRAADFSRGRRRAGLRRPGYKAVLPAGGAGFRFFLRRDETEKAHLGESPAFSPLPAHREQPHDSL
jgi:hypothetical protein